MEMIFESRNRGWMMLDLARDCGMILSQNNGDSCRKVSSSPHHVTFEAKYHTLKSFSDYLCALGIGHMMTKVRRIKE